MASDTQVDLHAVFRSALGARVTALAAAGEALREGRAEVVESIRRMAHTLRGTGGTYGFPEVSVDAAACEEAPAGELPAALDRLLSTLRRVIASGPSVAHTILLVEDDLAISALVQMALAAQDRRIFAVQTALGARMVLEDHEPALIILDLVLPDADGRNFLVQMREHPETARVPILVLSALTSTLVKAECMALGADDYVAKPFDPPVLVAKVERILARGAEAPEPAQPPAEPSTLTVSAPLGPILLAEDDDLIAAVIGHRLAREGLELVRFADGEAALGAAEATPYALFILDVKMPAMDGFELLSRLRALPAYETTPILMLTSMGSERDITRGLELGADDYIVKPFSPVELVARVSRHLRR